MAQKFADAITSSSPANSGFAGGVAIHLSDGTVVWVEINTSNQHLLCYSSNHTSSNLISNLDTSTTDGIGVGYAEDIALCCDSSDNIYVIGEDATNGGLTICTFVKGSGYSWTQKNIENNGAMTMGGGSLAAVWCNTGGGTGSHGHILVVGQGLSTLTTYATLDAGVALAGSGTLGVHSGNDPTFLGLPGANSYYSLIRLTANGFGATSGLSVTGHSYSGGFITPQIGVWAVNSSGVLSTNSVGSASLSGVYSGASYTTMSNWHLLNLATNVFVFVAGGSGSTIWAACGLDQTGATTGTGENTVTGPTNMPAVAEKGGWFAFVDPDTANQFWILAGAPATSGSQPMWRLQCNIASGTVSLTSVATADDTLTNPTSDISNYGTFNVFGVNQPRNSIVDWFCIVYVSGSYYLDGDSTPFAAAPSAPTLTSPSNASYQDVSSGLAFAGTYNPTDGTNQNAYAFRIKVSGGSYNYWNAGTNALQGTIVWNTDSVAPGGSFGPTLPNTAVSNGNVYNWSMASQESAANIQGPFASDSTFTSQAGPSVTVNAPSGTIVGTTTPAISWTSTPAAGASQTAYQIIVETGAYGTTPGSGTQIWTSGTVTSSSQNALFGSGGTPGGASVTPGVAFRVFVQVTETGGQTSPWAYSTATATVDVPGTPIVTALATNDGVTGCPCIEVTVTGQDNFLSAADSSFENSVGTFTAGANTTISSSSTEFLDGSYSLKLVASGSGTISAVSGTYPVSPGQEITAFAAFRAGSTGRTCTIKISWVGAAGSATSSGTADTSGAWTQASELVAPAAGLIANGTAPAGATGYTITLSVASAAGSEIHYADCVGVLPYTASPIWAIGGLSGTTYVTLLRSDGNYVRWASLANPLALGATATPPGYWVTNSPGTQVATVNDYEVSPGDAYTYTAQVITISPALSSATATSNSATVPGAQGWWELNVLNPATAVNCNFINYAPTTSEQATSHPVMGQTTQNVVSNTIMEQDFTATAETFTSAVYSAFNALLTSQQILWVSSPISQLDCGWYRIGPPTLSGGGGSSGTSAKSTTLFPSTSASPHREVAILAIAQPRPTV